MTAETLDALAPHFHAALPAPQQFAQERRTEQCLEDLTVVLGKSYRGQMLPQGRRSANSDIQAKSLLLNNREAGNAVNPINPLHNLKIEHAVPGNEFT